MQFALLALLLVIAFVPQLNFANLKAYLNQPIGTEVMWGQAYSPNIGWINFYCDGAGNTQPVGKSGGVTTMSDACGTTAYQTEYNPITGNFSGEAYSSNYGWLSMNGLQMDAPVDTLSVTEMLGSSNGSGISPYNFGTTYFAEATPNSFNPGVRYYNDRAYFCGFAYSDQVGYISFCDPLSKELSPSSVPGFDGYGYAVYMGTDEDLTPQQPASISPVLTTPNRIIATTDGHSDYLSFQDDDFPIASATVSITDASGNPQTYSATDFDDAAKTAGVTISNLDLHAPADYIVTYTACDTNNNCANNVPFNAFFQVVANAPVWNSSDCSNAHPSSNCPSRFGFTSDRKISDGVENHTVGVTLADRFGNPVISVDGIKRVNTRFDFINTTKLNQLAGTGDSAIFRSSEFALNQAGGNTTPVFTEANNGDGIFQIDVASLAPTSVGYDPISSNGINLNFDKINLTVEALNGYSGVGEYSSDVPNSDPLRIFAFSPTLIAEPIALIWDGSNFAPDPDGVNSIAVNTEKNFRASLQNQSVNIGVTSPEIGIALDSGDPAIVLWDNGEIVAAGSSTGLTEGITLDTNGDSVFDATLKNLSSWIGGIVADYTDDSLIFHATPDLMVPTAPASLITTLRTFLCYNIAGQEICHNSGLLTNDPAERNASVEIIGSLHSNSGTSADVNQSIGNFFQSEFREAMNRTLAPIRANSSRACSASDALITSASQFDSLSCRFSDNGVLYFKGSDVTLNLTSGELPNNARTLLVEGGNLYIKSNLKYPSNASSFGVIILKNGTGEGGNIYIDPSVTNLVGAVYAEGSVISVNSQGQFVEDPSPSCDGSAGFCDRSYELRNQLYWKGLLATANTIGGSDKVPTYECPHGITCSSREIARIYDFAYLRTFYPSSSGVRANNPATTSNASFVVEYDARVQNNTPPLFGSIGTGSSSEI